LAKKVLFSIVLFLLVECLGIAQNTPQNKSRPAQPPDTADFVDQMAQRLSRDLNVKTVIGEPIKVGSVTLIPILQIDTKFGSAGTTGPSGANAPKGAVPAANLFYMSGEARPLGFVAITKKGTHFIHVAKEAVK
jgi:uncharacterized spore protein YtfJ